MFGSKEAADDEKPMGTISVGIADMACSDQPTASLITYALGSCLGVTLYDPLAQVGGMLHLMLPYSKLNGDREVENPFMYVDTGLPQLFTQFYALGGRRERAVVKVAGGAQLMDSQGRFRIGERNCIMLKKLLWKNNIAIAAEELGGGISRTMTLEIGNGRVVINTAGRLREL